MTLLPGSTSQRLTRWARIRRYAVPRWMIEEATAAREAGDWRTACAVSYVDIAIDLAAVAAEYGGEVAERLEDDLRHLAPDLLRWHLPRIDKQQTFLPRRRIVLASYGPSHRSGPYLVVRTPDEAKHPQRLRLELHPRTTGRGTRVWWTGLRHLWDARRSDELRVRSGGSAERSPFFEADGTPRSFDAARWPADGVVEDPAERTEYLAALHRQRRIGEAFTAAGLDFATWSWRHNDPLGALAATPIAPTQLAPALAALRPVSDIWVVNYDDGSLLIQDKPDRIRVQVFWWQVHGPPQLPRAAWERPIDLDLVAAGRLSPEELHPLVRSALFPKRSPGDGPLGPPDPRPPRPVSIRCLDEWHHVSPLSTTLHVSAHSADDLRREETLARLGGRPSRCATAKWAWDRGGAALPRHLHTQRVELFSRMRHGDLPGVMAMLDAGFDPFVRDTDGRSLLHYLAHVDHERLVPCLRAAGMTISGTEPRDHRGQTPLDCAIRYGAPPSLVTLLRGS